MASFWCNLTAALGHERHHQRLKSKLHWGDQLQLGQLRQSLCRFLVYLEEREKLFDQSEMAFRFAFVKILSENYTSGTQIRPNDNHEP